MSRVIVVPTATAVVPEELVALRSGAGIALIVATVLASTVGFYDAFVVNVTVPAHRSRSRGERRNAAVGPERLPRSPHCC